jgi:hypothetical protein
MQVEFHIIKEFRPRILIGLEVMLDYEIDPKVSSLTGTIRSNLPSFPLQHPYQPFQSVLIRSSKRIIVPGRSIVAIKIKYYMADG